MTLNLWHVSKSPFGFLNISVVLDLMKKNIFKFWLPWHMIQSLEFWQEIQGKLVQKKRKHGKNISDYFGMLHFASTILFCFDLSNVKASRVEDCVVGSDFSHQSSKKYTAGILSVPTSHHDIGEI